MLGLDVDADHCSNRRETEAGRKLRRSTAGLFRRHCAGNGETAAAALVDSVPLVQPADIRRSSGAVATFVRRRQWF